LYGLQQVTRSYTEKSQVIESGDAFRDTGTRGTRTAGEKPPDKPMDWPVEIAPRP